MIESNGDAVGGQGAVGPEGVAHPREAHGAAPSYLTLGGVAVAPFAESLDPLLSSHFLARGDDQLTAPVGERSSRAEPGNRLFRVLRHGRLSRGAPRSLFGYAAARLEEQLGGQTGRGRDIEVGACGPLPVEFVVAERRPGCSQETVALGAIVFEELQPYAL